MNFNFKKLPPFKWFVLQNFPFIEADFDAITYYQLLCKIVDYLNKVIDENNLIGEQTENLTNAFNELQDYVNHYFDNLDIQNEINIKLDEMAESGELADLVSQYLQSQAIIGFQTSNDLKNATNLGNNSIVRTLGDLSVNDGKGAFYKVRTRLNSDVPDGYNLISLDNTENLVAEIIPDYFRNNLQNQINEINENLENNDTLFMGDSYAAGTTFEHGEVEYLTSWCEYLRRLMGLTTGHYYIFAQGNAGFAKIGNNSMNFQMTLASRINEITDRNKIKNIIVCAGYNDRSEELSLIIQRIGEFVAYCKEQFPNAQVYIGMIGGNSATTYDGALIRENLIMKVLHAYQYCNQFGAIYLNGVEKCTHNFYIFNTEGNHPNESGYKYMAEKIYNAFKNGSATLIEPITSVSIPTLYNNTINFQCTMQNETKTIFMTDYSSGNQVNIDTTNTDTIRIAGPNQNKAFKSTFNGKSICMNVDCYVKDSSNVVHIFPATLKVLNDGSIEIKATYIAIYHPTVTSLIVWGHTMVVPLLYS